MKAFTACLFLLCLICPRFGYADDDYCDDADVQTTGLKTESSRPFSQDAITFFALGDWGTGEEQQFQVAELLRGEFQKIKQQGPPNPPFVLGLGDSLYESARHYRGWEKRDLTLSELKRTFADVFADLSTTPVVFHVVPGNHDHLGDVRLLETAAERVFDGSGNTPVWKFYPLGLPELPDSNDQQEYEALSKHQVPELALPQLIPAPNGLTIVALDTQAMLEMYQDPNYWSPQLKRHQDQIETLFRSAPAGSWKILVGHHPALTHGKNGVNVPWYRKFYTAIRGRTKDEQAAYAYEILREELRDVIRDNQVDLYLSGHEHNLQFIDLGERRYQIVSGAAAKTSPAGSCSDTIFSSGLLGLTRFDIIGETLWVEFIYLDAGKRSSRLFALSKAAASAEE